ncbi:MAG TPA: hypothetical protein ENK57_12060 [Polyangiaceae bacterium]|nr:hypothetical protein [Polyangiaceae bacterium]
MSEDEGQERSAARWVDRVKLVERRGELARAILAGERDELLRSNDIGRALEAVGTATRAVSKAFAPYNSAHEAYGVLAEEVAELFDEVRKKSHLRSRLALRNEAIDVAVVAVRIAALYGEEVDDETT